MPEWLKQQIALTWVVSATSRAATVIASETPDRPAVRCASMTWRKISSPSTDSATLFIAATASTG